MAMRRPRFLSNLLELLRVRSYLVDGHTVRRMDADGLQTTEAEEHGV